MRIERALAVVRSMNEPRRGRQRPVRPSIALTYQPPAPSRKWTWDDATPAERANWVRANRKLGVMDWDLCELFDLTPDGLAAIVRGGDWRPEYSASGQGGKDPHG